MSEKVEQVAKALRTHDCSEVLERDGVVIPAWDADTDEARKEAYRRSARAAIEALR